MDELVLSGTAVLGTLVAIAQVALWRRFLRQRAKVETLWFLALMISLLIHAAAVRTSQIGALTAILVIWIAGGFIAVHSHRDLPPPWHFVMGTVAAGWLPSAVLGLTETSAYFLLMVFVIASTSLYPIYLLAQRFIESRLPKDFGLIVGSLAWAAATMYDWMAASAPIPETAAVLWVSILLAGAASHQIIETREHRGDHSDETRQKLHGV